MGNTVERHYVNWHFCKQAHAKSSTLIIMQARATLSAMHPTKIITTVERFFKCPFANCLFRSNSSLESRSRIRHSHSAFLQLKQFTHPFGNTWHPLKMRWHTLDLPAVNMAHLNQHPTSSPNCCPLFLPSPSPCWAFVPQLERTLNANTFKTLAGPSGFPMLIALEMVCAVSTVVPIIAFGAPL